jgi:hypothetical protein
MATFEQIKSIRLMLCDPAGINNILQIADESNLPAAPKKDAAYYSLSSYKYYVTDKESGAVLADYEQPKLYLSDETIGDLYDAHGYDVALVKAARRILPHLFSELKIKRISSGTESTDYVALKEAYEYMKSLINDYADDAGLGTGQWIHSKSVRRHIAGGNL